MINTKLKTTYKTPSNKATFTYGLIERDRKLLRLMALLVIYRDEFSFEKAVKMLSKGDKDLNHLELLILSLGDNIEYHMEREYESCKDNCEELIQEAIANCDEE